MATIQTIKMSKNPRMNCADQPVSTCSFYRMWLDLKINPPVETS